MNSCPMSIGSFRAARLPGQATRAAEPLCHSQVSVSTIDQNFTRAMPVSGTASAHETGKVGRLPLAFIIYRQSTPTSYPIGELTITYMTNPHPLTPYSQRWGTQLIGP